MAHSSKVQKTCFILVRYFVKRSKSICCIIRNEQGTQYTTCLHANGRTSCTCDAGMKGVKCYHAKHLIAVEQARSAIAARQIVATPATPVQVIPNPMLTHEAETTDRELEDLLAVVEAQHAAHGLKMLPGASQVVKDKMTTGHTTDLGTMGTLNGNRGFSLMR